MPTWRRLIVGSEDQGGCRVWTRAIQRNGYGCMSLDGKRYLAHRVSYETFIGPIPDGAVIDHLCRNRACILPAHLEPVTHAENTRRGAQRPGSGAIPRAIVDEPVNCPKVDRTPAEMERIGKARALLDSRLVRRRDVADQLRAQGTPIAVETLSLYRYGHMCPSEVNLAAVERAVAAIITTRIQRAAA